MKVGDLVVWWLPDMEKEKETPPLGLVLEADEEVLYVQWVDNGLKDFVNLYNCYKADFYYESGRLS